ncbi:uncharacterized protein LOC134675085 [Cydia fagiglandana]|uniref:uncharacterized protein LOC134675085 n=1 Tax=Cydia fagiglandana TaxID=1458189 RepID=UPI002FEE3437
MGQDDNIHAALSHVVLCCVTGPSLGRVHIKNYTHPGMHTNLLIHGIVGFLHYHGGFGDVAEAYKISLAASRYLPIPCLMADLTRGDDVRSILHLLSGLVPFVIAVSSGKEDRNFGNLMVFINIVCLALYSHEKNSEWGWYTAGAAVFSYLAAPVIGGFGPKVLYPLGLALVDYCGYRVHGVARQAAEQPPRR